MKKLTTADSLVMVRHYRNLLESEGIACKIRNEHLTTIAGEIPFFETWPELWIVHDLDYDRARQLIDGATADDHPGSSWTCPACGEEIEGQFAACWNCGKAL